MGIFSHTPNRIHCCENLISQFTLRIFLLVYLVFSPIYLNAQTDLLDSLPSSKDTLTNQISFIESPYLTIQNAFVIDTESDFNKSNSNPESKISSSKTKIYVSSATFIFQKEDFKNAEFVFLKNKKLELKSSPKIKEKKGQKNLAESTPRNTVTPKPKTYLAFKPMKSNKSIGVFTYKNLAVLSTKSFPKSLSINFDSIQSIPKIWMINYALYLDINPKWNIQLRNKDRAPPKII